MLSEKVTIEGLFFAAERTLRVESLSFGRTRLEPHHCPHFPVVQETFGINLYTGGTLTLETGGRTVDIADGTVTLVPAGAPRKYTNHNPGRTISTWHCLQMSIMDTIDPLLLLDVPLAIGGEHGRRISEINDALMQEEVPTEQNFLRHAAVRHRLAMQLFEIVLSVCSVRPDAQKQLAKTDRLQPALQHIKENLSAKITIAEIASMLHVSQPHLFELFRSAMGVSPGKYLQQQRMRKAQNLLIGTDLKISEVGETVGYEDQFLFSRMFKKSTGTSPAMFRKQWR